ncbi:RBBP9/YdeN family alpha/beta hydrolase [Thalassovita sp.]|uniref:RBBP9/YdeN family alpha/beta hydrolase n=1 Tax=Thalassovita sp. TaxID=1979401 RepID=UPI0029DE5180|nr:alpha/beta hydrolase [Thalassovita sp.]
MTQPTILIVPGLRDHVPQHWQTLLAARLDKVRTVAPMGRQDLDCGARCAAIEQEAQAIEGDIVLVAHSGGVVTVAHWAQSTRRQIKGAVLATPPDFETPMPDGYPGIDALEHAGWLPVPWCKLPFPSIVAASRNDPLARFDRVAEMADDWGSALVDLGDVGHLNPASGFGEWPGALDLIDRVAGGPLSARKTA